MINRQASSTLIRLARQFPIVGVTGPRQSRKSTLTKAIFPNKKYVTFDDRTMREFAKSNPADFVAAFPDGAIIDEAQKVPDIFDALKMHVDSVDSPPGKFILTGSSQLRLKTNMADSLAGRAAFLRLLPFSVRELDSANVLPKDPYDLIFGGQYPPLHDTGKQLISADWYESCIDTYLDLDIQDQINPSNLSTFRKFVQVCAAHSGQLLSMDSIAQKVGMSAPTVKSWLSILEASFIIHFLEADTNNLGKRLSKRRSCISSIPDCCAIYFGWTARKSCASTATKEPSWKHLPFPNF